VRRDADVKKQLRAAGWKVRVIWACELNETKLRKLASEIAATKGRTR
jgi:G:T-mismatch repair DNA endonuclease (very short patch repair protein)